MARRGLSPHPRPTTRLHPFSRPAHASPGTCRTIALVSCSSSLGDCNGSGRGAGQNDCDSPCSERLRRHGSVDAEGSREWERDTARQQHQRSDVKRLARDRYESSEKCVSVECLLDVYLRRCRIGYTQSPPLSTPLYIDVRVLLRIGWK